MKYKIILKNTLISTMIAMSISLFVLMILEIHQQGIITTTNYYFVRIILSSLVIGIGFGFPAYIYEYDHFSFLLKIIIHMGIGSIVLAITSSLFFHEVSHQYIFGMIFFEILIAWTIWLGYYLYHLFQAKKMNHQLRHKQFNEHYNK